MKDRNPDRIVTFVVRTNAHGSRALFRHLSIWMNGRWGFRYVTDFTERLMNQEKDNDDKKELPEAARVTYRGSD